MPRRRPVPPPPAGPTHLERVDTWSGLRQDDAVDVLDDRAPGATWRFASFVTNVESGDAWVEVVGGRDGERRRRSFRPDQLYPQGSIRAGVPTAASLSSQPRLLL